MRVKPDVDITVFDPVALNNQRKLKPNFSRYMGDQLGVYSNLTLGQFEKAIHRSASIDLTWWGQDLNENWDTKGGNGDPLAWDDKNNKDADLRATEIAAVAPDQFDTAYYSIDPDFTNNYLNRIRRGYDGKFQFLLRGDLGSRLNGSEFEKRFSVRNQIDTAKDAAKFVPDTTGKLTYYLNQFGQLLTSWQQKTPDQYLPIDDDRFGKCDPEFQIKQDADPKFFTMGSCKAGGRTGYSVKLVDGKFLQNIVNGAQKIYELGGPGVGGTIKNPPPAGF